MQDMGTGSEFYEDDEPVAKIAEAFERGEKGLTAPPPSWGHTEYLLLGGLGITGFLHQTDNDTLGERLRH
jgi:hypothetical protein